VEAREIEQFFEDDSVLAATAGGFEASWRAVPDRVIPMQRNWIGKSIGRRFGLMWKERISHEDAEGTEKRGKSNIEIFTTRIDDDLWGHGDCVAPTHPL